jgi:hypothetical protein
MQDKCSLMQVQFSTGSLGGTVRFQKCVGHKGMMKLVSDPFLSIKAVKCTNCSGCKECKQPVPLTLPDSIGGSGCTAKVAAKAEALRQLAASKASASRSSAAGTQQQTGSGRAGGINQATGLGSPASEASATSNSALTECAVCHRKPGGPGAPVTLKVCGGCQRIRYCSTECQKKDWKLGHKVICEQWRKRNKPS